MMSEGRPVFPFELGDEYAPEHQLPWQLMQNGPVTKYWRRDYLEEDMAELRSAGFEVPCFDCAEWTHETDVLDALKSGLGLPDYTGQNWNAIDDSLTEMEIPTGTGVVVAFVNFDALENVVLPRSRVDRSAVTDLLEVFAGASRRWLLFGRMLAIALQTNDPSWEGPPTLGATSPQWNRREQLASSRAP